MRVNTTLMAQASPPALRKKNTEESVELGLRWPVLAPTPTPAPTGDPSAA